MLYYQIQIERLEICNEQTRQISRSDIGHQQLHCYKIEYVMPEEMEIIGQQQSLLLSSYSVNFELLSIL